MEQLDSPNLRQKCGFFVEKKKRSCRMWALKGEKYCGEHTVHDTKDPVMLNSVPEDRLRIKCPLDNTHTCFAKKLQKHLKVCNARVTEIPPYFVRDINSGESEVPPEDGMTIHQLSDRGLLGLLERIRTLYRERVRPTQLQQETHPVLDESLACPEYGPDTLKHLRQNSALLAVLRDGGLLDGRSTFVELGSGKAQLSFWLARAVSSQAQIVLVDRASHRHKAENKLKDLSDVPDIQRLKIDIQHLNLAGCGACVGRPVVAISKHLCGAATDLGIRAATARSAPTSTAYHGTAESAAGSAEPAEIAAGPTEPADSAAGPLAGSESESSRHAALDVRAVLIALCCHHRVEWGSYVGKQFLLDCGFSAAEFTALKGVAAWATCGTPSWEKAGQANGDLRTEARGQAVAGAADQATADQTTADQMAAETTADQTPIETAADRAAVDRTTTDQTTDQATADQTSADQTTAGEATAEAAGSDQTAPGLADDTDPASPHLSAAGQGASDASLTADPAQKRPGGGGGAADPAAAKRCRLDEPGPGSRDASAGRYQRLGLSPEQRTAVGFMCKRLMDEGRARYLAARGFTVRLVQYVPARVSPENVLLLATR